MILSYSSNYEHIVRWTFYLSFYFIQYNKRAKSFRDLYDETLTIRIHLRYRRHKTKQNAQLDEKHKVEIVREGHALFIGYAS